MRSIILASALAVAQLGVLTSPAYADKAPIYTGILNNTALSGYDATSFFEEGGAVKGVKAHSTVYEGAEFRFANAENLAKFEADPQAFAPQYGGYCAWAVSQGYTAKGDPKYARVVDGKLYLNYNKSIQEQWEADRANFIIKADENWPTVLKD